MTLSRTIGCILACFIILLASIVTIVAGAEEITQGHYTFIYLSGMIFWTLSVPVLIPSTIISFMRQPHNYGQ